MKNRRWPEIPVKWGNINSSAGRLFEQLLSLDDGRDFQAALAKLKELEQVLQAEYRAKHAGSDFAGVKSAIDLIEAFYRFQMGEIEFGWGIWEREIKGGNGNPQIYYYLGTLYHKKGQLQELLELNRQIENHLTRYKESNQSFDFEAWKVLQRWLASLLPDYAVQKTPDGKAAPVIKKVTISPKDPGMPTRLLFESYVEDTDGTYWI